jgi:hypothetical protein
MCYRDVIQLMLQALIAVCVVHLTASVSFSRAAQMVPDCTSVNGANAINFHLVMQLQLCDQSVQTCIMCRCFAEAVWSALLDWHLWLMGCGSDEGGFLFLFIFFFVGGGGVIEIWCHYLYRS